MKVFVTSFQTDMSSDTCRKRPGITGSSGGRVYGTGEVIDGNVFCHLRELTSCDSDGGITTKIPLFDRLDRFSRSIAFELDIPLSGLSLPPNIIHRRCRTCTIRE